MSLIARATTPTASGVTPATIAADIVKYGGPALAVLEALENIPGVGLDVSGPAQGVIAAVITILSAVLSVVKQQAVATAKAGQ
jgi:hypothetical protein